MLQVEDSLLVVERVVWVNVCATCLSAAIAAALVACPAGELDG